MCWAPPRVGEPGLYGRASGVHKVTGTMVETVVGGCFINSSVSYLAFHPTGARAYRPVGREHRSQGFPYSATSPPITTGAHHSGYQTTFARMH